jgi:hypothetical protein
VESPYNRATHVKVFKKEAKIFFVEQGLEKTTFYFNFQTKIFIFLLEDN